MAVSNDVAERLERDMEAASKNVAKRLPAAMGGTGAEVQYSLAYQALVRAGLRPQMKKKYRA